MINTHIPRFSLQAEAVNRIRAEIVEGELLPGTRLQERVLCEKYGISRSPLREAFQVLAAESLIDILPNKGALVTAPTPSIALQNFELLCALELLAIRLASQHASKDQIAAIVEADTAMTDAAAKADMQSFFRANNDVHRRIVLASGNTPLVDTHLITSRQLIRIQNLDGPLEHLASEGVHQHHEIILALEAHDADRATDLLRAHLATVGENLRARLRQWDVPQGV